MMDQMKLEILKKIMEEMRAADSGRLMQKPAAMAIEIEKKPIDDKASDEDKSPDTTLVRDGELATEEKDPEDMSDEDAGILEKLLAGKEEDDEEPSEEDQHGASMLC